MRASTIIGGASDKNKRNESDFYATPSECTIALIDALPDTLVPFFEHMRDSYHVFLKVSREALAAGEKWCEVDLGDGPIPMRSLKYSEVSRCHIRREILNLSPEDRAAVDRVLGPLGVLDAYLLPPLTF